MKSGGEEAVSRPKVLALETRDLEENAVYNDVKVRIGVLQQLYRALWRNFRMDRAKERP